MTYAAIAQAAVPNSRTGLHHPVYNFMRIFSSIYHVVTAYLFMIPILMLWLTSRRLPWLFQDVFPGSNFRPGKSRGPGHLIFFFNSTLMQNWICEHVMSPGSQLSMLSTATSWLPICSMHMIYIFTYKNIFCESCVLEIDSSVSSGNHGNTMDSSLTCLCSGLVAVPDCEILHVGAMYILRSLKARNCTQHQVIICNPLRVFGLGHIISVPLTLSSMWR